MSVSMEAAAQIYQDAGRSHVRKASLRYLIEAGVLILAGVLATIFPVISSAALVLTIGWLLIISGVVPAIGLIATHRAPFAGLQFISATLALLIGFLILRHPAQSLVTLSLLIIVFFMIEGISKIGWVLTIRPLNGWFWVLLSGVLGVVLSLVLISSIDTAAGWLLAMLVGVQLIAMGTSVGYLAWTARQTGRA